MVVHVGLTRVLAGDVLVGRVRVVDLGVIVLVLVLAAEMLERAARLVPVVRDVEVWVGVYCRLVVMLVLLGLVDGHYGFFRRFVRKASLDRLHPPCLSGGGW